MSENFTNAGLPGLVVPLDEERKDPPGRCFRAVQYRKNDIRIEFEADLKEYLKEQAFSMKDEYNDNQCMSMMAVSQTHGFLLFAWSRFVIVVTA
jgi:hypothetical protein